MKKYTIVSSILVATKDRPEVKIDGEFNQRPKKTFNKDYN